MIHALPYRITEKLEIVLQNLGMHRIYEKGYRIYIDSSLSDSISNLYISDLNNKVHVNLSSIEDRTPTDTLIRLCNSGFLVRKEAEEPVLHKYYVNLYTPTAVAFQEHLITMGTVLHSTEEAAKAARMQDLQYPENHRFKTVATLLYDSHD